LGEIAVCILPWQLLLWWAKSRLTRLSEQACDDWVLATGQQGADYAESLLDLSPGGQMSFVPAVVSSKKGLSGRIRRILKDNCANPRTGALWALAVSTITLCLALGVAFAQTRPAKPDFESTLSEPNESAASEPNESAVGELNKDELVQRFYRLKHYSAAQMGRIIEPLISDLGHQTANEDTSTLLIVDTVENLKRIERIIDQLDAGDTEILKEYEIVQLGYTDVGEVAKRLEEAIQQMPDAELPQGVLIQPLANARQIAIFGRKDLREMVKKLITEWDVPLDMEKLKPRILKLHNSDPAQMAKLLTTLFAGDGEDGMNIYKVLFGKAAPEERKTIRSASWQLKFEEVPGTKKIIIISNFGEAYDLVGKLILELDKQEMAAKDVKQVRQWIGEWIAKDGSKVHGVALPVGWALDYDDGRRAGGARTWPGNMAEDLARLRIRQKKYDPSETSSKDERYEFRILSLQGNQIGDISIRPESEIDIPSSKIFKPGKYLLRYRRRWGPPGDNFRVESGEYSIDLNRPGMYELHFTPKLGTAEIKGTLGGCYAVNLEKIGHSPWFRGFAYLDPRLDKQYFLDGLPAGKYLLSAVTQRQSGSVFVDRAEVTVAAGEKVAIDMARPPKGGCSLEGTILGKQGKYATPWPTTWPQSQGKWYVLIRDFGSSAVGRVDAYEALTMDSLYVVRGHNLTQESEDRARYRIEGLAPGDYTVTAIEHPSWEGCVVTRQQSKPLSLRAGEDAVLDFDLRTIPEHD
jgi:hypothetical protein